MEAAAVSEIGLSRDEFWSLTPRQFQRFYDRYREREIRHERRTALLATMYRNAHRSDGEQPFTIDDFAPPLPSQQEPAFEGPAFLKPCRECKVPKWQGHLLGCKLGQRQFEQAVAKATHAAERAQEKAAQHGQVVIEPRK